MLINISDQICDYTWDYKLQHGEGDYFLVILLNYFVLQEIATEKKLMEDKMQKLSAVSHELQPYQLLNFLYSFPGLFFI